MTSGTGNGREAQAGAGAEIDACMTNLLGGLIAWFGLGALIFTFYQAFTWPDVKSLRTENPETTAFIERHLEREKPAHRPSRVAWRWVPYDRISPHMKRAVLVAEDNGFFSHNGFAVEEMKWAVRDAVTRDRALRGASTITQQLAKNLWLAPSRSALRKGKEVILTRQLERNLPKRRILELYLNVVEFGRGIYGAEAAAQHYFDKHAIELSEEEAAQLAAALPRPKTWNPESDSENYRRYVARIKERMEQATFLQAVI